MAYSDEQLEQILHGALGRVRYRLLLHNSSIMGEKGDVLEGVEDISITLNNFNDWAWELSCTVRNNFDFNPLSDYVKAYLYIAAGSDEWSEYPMGLYRFESPKGVHSTSTSWELTGRSLEWLVLEDTAPKGLYIPANSAIIPNCKSILQTMVPPIPVERIKFPSESVIKTTRKDIFFDPLQDAENTRKKRIIDTLLNSGGWHKLYTDADGYFTTSVMEDFRTAQPAAFYSTEAGAELVVNGILMRGQQLIKTDDISDEYDEDNFANRVVVQSAAANEKTPVIVVLENNDPNDPLSTVNFGRIKQADPITMQDVVGQAEAYLVALQALAMAAGRYRTVSFSTPPDPRRTQLREHFVVRVRLEAENRPIGGKWRVLSWTLTDDGMEFNLARLEPDGDLAWQDEVAPGV